MKLGVNIDHVATLRQARGTCYPDPVQAAKMVEQAGGDSITVHLREDRRHIQDHDLPRLKAAIKIPINLEMALTEEMLVIAEQLKPEHVCLVPEKREELTTEGGLNVLENIPAIQQANQRLMKVGIELSLFIDPEFAQIEAAHQCGVPAIEIHTGAYAEAKNEAEQLVEYDRIKAAVSFALSKGLIVNAGHGLHYDNVQKIVQIAGLDTLNIGHSIIAQALFDGLENAVRKMKFLLG